jgi:tRNA nucleotidyltransferase (CCA-adding enzyme)
MAALLPAGLRRTLALAGDAARECGTPAYLVGGTVRDLLLGRANLDLDLVVEGDAALLAQALGEVLAATVTPHPEFGTATLCLPWQSWDAVSVAKARRAPHVDGLHVDLATARTEHYPRPGALPIVAPGADLVADLRRRDFSTNAMAVALTAGDAGRLIDPYGGLDDLAAGRLAVLHAASFEDDPTRLLRGARLAGRGWLRFAPETERLVREAVTHGWLALISGERRRHELELVLAEEQPALALALMRVYGLTEQVHPALHWDAWLAERLRRSTEWVAALPRVAVRLALFAYRWPRGVIESFVALTRPDGATQALLEALPSWHDRRPALVAASTGSAVAAALDALPLPTLAAARLAEDEEIVLRHLDWYATVLRGRRPRLGGEALRALGLPPGPHYRPILADLRQAVLDERLPDEAAEWEYLRQRVARETST